MIILCECKSTAELQYVHTQLYNIKRDQINKSLIQNIVMSEVNNDGDDV